MLLEFKDVDAIVCEGELLSWAVGTFTRAKGYTWMVFAKPYTSAQEFLNILEGIIDRRISNPFWWSTLRLRRRLTHILLRIRTCMYNHNVKYIDTHISMYIHNVMYKRVCMQTFTYVYMYTVIANALVEDRALFEDMR